MLSKIRAASVALILSLTANGHADLLAPPADPLLNTRGRAVLEYFQQLQASDKLKLVSGQYCGWSGSAKLEVLGKIQQATGKWPAVIGLDYCRFLEGQPVIDTTGPNRLAAEYWRSGGLVTISWHSFNPANPHGGGLKERGMNIAEVLADGTPTHDRWIKALDHVAAGLQELQEAGVVVLWRPLHEMNGGWFWWGAQKPADFIKVWQQMFDYFTKTKGLHNLIWVYGPNHGQHTADYYPGDTYADLVGFDAYTDHIDPEHIKGYPELAAINKPFGFSEYGPHGASNPPGDYDYRRLLSGVEKNFPRARFFLSWDEKWNPAENKFAREFYADPRVVTRSDLPAGLAGENYATDLATWRAQRVANLTKPDSWLSLIGRHALQPGENSLGTANDNSIKLAAGPPYLGTVKLEAGKVTFTPAPSSLVEIDGKPAQPSELVYAGDNPTEVKFGSASFYVIQRGDSLFLRVRDSAAVRLKDFAGIDYFPTDLSWRIEAEWVPFDPPHQVNITNMIGQTSPTPVPGKAVFTRDGHTYELLPIDEGDGELFFIFTDLTAGEETYEAARFLYSPKPQNGKVILDFNRARNPPCAFTPFATCPLPPKGNSLPIRVNAGEKKYRGSHQ